MPNYHALQHPFQFTVSIIHVCEQLIRNPPEIFPGYNFKLSTSHLPHHLLQRQFCYLRIICRMGISISKLRTQVFKIRQINIHQAFKHPQRFYLFISGSIVHDWKF